NSVDKKAIVSTQIIFCLKEKNKGKTGSNQWFFNAFCPTLNPQICVLIEVGVRPGVCGKLDATNNRSWTKSLNPVVGAQLFENKIYNTINKPFESIFGYIPSLPKGFSAYRYSALRNITNDIEDASKNNNILTNNDYLAKNNVLCFELISKYNSSWILYYEHLSKAEVDIPENLPEMIQQN
ncbi:15298_t:CDS:2, partial [Cetraspora pellucida]